MNRADPGVGQLEDRGVDQSEASTVASPPEAGLECDFCQLRVPSVRRVALDADYERLVTPHAVQYACLDCFERKDRVRLGLAPSR